jgi:hypothetical protein
MFSTRICNARNLHPMLARIIDDRLSSYVDVKFCAEYSETHSSLGTGYIAIVLTELNLYWAFVDGYGGGMGQTFSLTNIGKVEESTYENGYRIKAFDVHGKELFSFPFETQEQIQSLKKVIGNNSSA